MLISEAFVRNNYDELYSFSYLNMCHRHLLIYALKA